VFENIDLDSIRKMMLKDLDGLYNSIEFIIEVWEGKRE
jgi:predicted transcriptional regulator